VAKILRSRVGMFGAPLPRSDRAAGSGGWGDRFYREEVLRGEIGVDRRRRGGQAIDPHRARRQRLHTAGAPKGNQARSRRLQPPVRSPPRNQEPRRGDGTSEEPGRRGVATVPPSLRDCEEGEGVVAPFRWLKPPSLCLCPFGAFSAGSARWPEIRWYPFTSMPTASAPMNRTSHRPSIRADERVRGVTFSEDSFTIEMVDGRAINIPLARFQRRPILGVVAGCLPQVIVPGATYWLPSARTRKMLIMG
jgi:hypothetical protein